MKMILLNNKSYIEFKYKKAKAFSISPNDYGHYNSRTCRSCSNSNRL